MVPEVGWPEDCHAWRSTEGRLSVPASHDGHCNRQGADLDGLEGAELLAVLAGTHLVAMMLDSASFIPSCRAGVRLGPMHCTAGLQQNLSPRRNVLPSLGLEAAEEQTICTLERRWAHHHGRIVTHDLEIAVWTAGTSR